MKTVTIQGLEFTYNPKTKSLITPKGELDYNEYKKASKAYKGVNRIYKPMAFLFWSDCINGKSSNWITNN